MATVTGRRASWNDRAVHLHGDVWRCVCGREWSDPESLITWRKVELYDREEEVVLTEIRMPAHTTAETAKAKALEVRGRYPDARYRVRLIEKPTPPPLRCPPCGKALLEDAREGRGPDYRPPVRIT